MSIHKEQRVGVFVDIQNMYYSAKQFYNSKVDFSQILRTAVAGRKLIRAIAYVIKADIKEEKNFFDALSKIGYDVRSKDLQVFFGGAKKGDWDVGIAMDIMRMASKLDVVVLVSGDGDFKDLIEHVKSFGCRAEVVAFGKTSSSRLREVADMFTDLDENKNRYLIKSRSILPQAPFLKTSTVQAQQHHDNHAQASISATHASVESIERFENENPTKSIPVKELKENSSRDDSNETNIETNSVEVQHSLALANLEQPDKQGKVVSTKFEDKKFSNKFGSSAGHEFNRFSSSSSQNSSNSKERNKVTRENNKNYNSNYDNSRFRPAITQGSQSRQNTATRHSSSGNVTPGRNQSRIDIGVSGLNAGVAPKIRTSSPLQTKNSIENKISQNSKIATVAKKFDKLNNDDNKDIKQTLKDSQKTFSKEQTNLEIVKKSESKSDEEQTEDKKKKKSLLQRVLRRKE